MNMTATFLMLKKSKTIFFCALAAFAAASPCAELRDARDGATYETVLIGDQVWMGENLRYLPRVDADESFDDPEYFVYGYDGSDVEAARATNEFRKYGVLYNWTAAQNACPEGWHLPDTTEWNALYASVGGKKVAALRLKSKEGWTKNGNGTDGHGFSILPGGYRNKYGDFHAVEDYAGFWTADSASCCAAFYNTFYYYYDNVFSGAGGKGAGGSPWVGKDYGFSVRCLKD